MDNYEVIGPLGAGSFGRVYKAKQLTDLNFVALKVISKRGRSAKELTGLRRECEIQRHLNHPNIIKMLDSFETKDEIVVITEFAQKELTKILVKEGYLSEEKVKPIVWDLVSALYYLHSHRILHRDLKPQNILLDGKNRAKLCDFGFARNMSAGTYVLTSIKGTPLYMAPELIEEQSYDHTADLWSLGCIIYELLVGAPPFNTTSIWNLIYLVRHGQIQWPTFLSDINCISFLKGLLQKDPKDRMTWPEILNHPLIKGHILILEEDVNSKPLTRPLSVNGLQVKEQQRKDIAGKSNFHKLSSTSVRSNEMTDRSKSCKTVQKSSDSQDIKNNNLTTSTDEKFNLKELKKSTGSLKTDEEKYRLSFSPKILNKQESNTSISEKRTISQLSENMEKLNFLEENQPMENDEWIVFLQKTMEEVMNGEMTSLTQQNLANIIVAPLRNSNANSKVICYVLRLLSIPFVICNTTSKETLEQIKKVYVEVKLIPNLVYASKLILKIKQDSSPVLVDFKNISDLSDDDIQALEYIYLLITHLVYVENEFLSQFCDAVVILNIYKLVFIFLSMGKVKLAIVSDILAILTHILRIFPENVELIDRIIVNDCISVNFVDLLRHSNELLREQSCFFLMFLGKYSTKMSLVWNENVKDTLEALMYDSIESVRNAAEKTVEELKCRDFYKL